MGRGELQQGVCHIAGHEAGAVDLERRKRGKLAVSSLLPQLTGGSQGMLHLHIFKGRASSCTLGSARRGAQCLAWFPHKRYLGRNRLNLRVPGFSHDL